MNGPLFAAAVISFGALWLLFMALPNLLNPPTFPEPAEKNNPEEKPEEQKQDS